MSAFSRSTAGRGAICTTGLKDMLLEWAFSSEDTMPAPVRADHFDESPLDYGMVEGRTELEARQSWYLDHMLPLYSGWKFQEDGKLR